MASLYKRPNSPFWWIKYRDDKTGKIKQESTGLRIGVGPETRRAEQLRAEYTLREANTTSASAAEKWDNWVEDFINTRYAELPQTRSRYLSAWRTVSMFLKEKEILLPRQLIRDHCFKYMVWRKKPDKSKGKYNAGHNTAHLELKLLSLLMKEAVIRGFAPFNPCRDLDIKRVRGKIKPEFTPEIVAMIRAAIRREPEPLRTFFQNSFDIAILHGVRLSETHLNPIEQVDIWETNNGPTGRITFHTKGGKTHTVMLHPELIPLFQKLRAEGATETYKKPDYPARTWHNFLKRAGIKAILPNACFHSTRVTVASTLARQGVPERKAMEYIGHASTTVHRSYVRLRPEDLSECSAALTAFASAGRSASRKSSDAPPTTAESGGQTHTGPSVPSPA